MVYQPQHSWSVDTPMFTIRLTKTSWFRVQDSECRVQGASAGSRVEG